MKKAGKRHGVRADGKSQTSVSLREEVLEAAREAAARENRSLSNWLENLLAEKLAIQAPRSESSGKNEE